MPKSENLSDKNDSELSKDIKIYSVPKMFLKVPTE